MRDDILTEIEFADLDLRPELLEGVRAAGFTRCTPIQARTLPLLLAGKDIAGQAQTGTGKTAAFLLAAMQRLLGRAPPRPADVSQPRTMILSPTRELAIQIHKDAVVLASATTLRLGLVYGGIDYDKQRRAIAEGVDILVGTPGRVIDYFRQGVFDLQHVEVLVLDEADRMFDLGFIRDIRYLLRRLPHPTKRLSMLFSATLSHRVNELAYEHMNNPQIVEVAPDMRTANKVEQVLYHVGSDEKIALLVGLFRSLNPNRTLVFVNTKRAAAALEAYLQCNGFEARTLSGDVEQRKRQRLVEQFSTGQLPILVATDVAARGLHIPEVSHVVNFDLPQNAEDYIHRIGRTARAGATGDAISFACEEYVFSLQSIEEYVGHKIPVRKVTEDLLAALRQPPRSAWRDPPGGARRRRPRARA